MGSKNHATDLHECRQRGAILIWRPQLPIGATILIADELTRLVALEPDDSLLLTTGPFLKVAVSWMVFGQPEVASIARR